jgi:hypothetical protein
MQPRKASKPAPAAAGHGLHGNTDLGEIDPVATPNPSPLKVTVPVRAELVGSDRYHAVGLQKYDAARAALAEAHRVDEVKTIRDQAVAMQTYARQARDTTLITQATEIRLRAERRAGELLKEMGTNKARHSGRGHTTRVGSRAVTPRPEPTLRDLGMTKSESSRWQKLASIPKNQFEVKVAGWRGAPRAGRTNCRSPARYVCLRELG